MLLQDRLALPHVRKVIVVSEHARGIMLRYGYPAGKLTVIHNAVSPPGDMDAVRRRGEELRSSLGIAGSPLIGTVGRMVPVKCQTALLEAIRKLKVRGRLVHAIMIGDGPLRQELEATAASLEIADQVRFLGIRSDALEWLAALDVFCLPSLCEGIPLVVLEAMTLGTPVIASASGGIPEIVEDGQTGTLIAPGDSKALAEAVEEVLSHPERTEEMTRRAATVARERFSFERLLNEVAQVYEECWRNGVVE
jgi:glycosyltransferase involved in cell wall biosynthesis